MQKTNNKKLKKEKIMKNNLKSLNIMNIMRIYGKKESIGEFSVCLGTEIFSFSKPPF